MELTIDQALQQGVAAHKEGKLQDAERLYRAILQAQPNHPDANHNLGVLAVLVGKPLEAIPFFKLAVEANPQIEQFWRSYIDALIKVERFDDAKRVLDEGEGYGVSSKKLEFLRQQIQAASPENKESTRQGLTVSEKRKKLAGKKKRKKRKAHGDASGAAPSQDQITRLLRAYHADRLAEAEEIALSLSQKFPRHPLGWKVLGVLLKKTGRLNESLLLMQKSAELSPHDAETHGNLGATLQKLGRLDEAESSYRQAIALKPDYAEAHSKLGNVLKEMGRLDEALWSYVSVINLQADNSYGYINLGEALKSVRFIEANRSLYPVLVNLLAKGNFVRPSDVAPAILSLLKRDKIIADLLLDAKSFNGIKELGRAIQLLSQNPLLHQLMRICRLPDLQLEDFFASIRRVLLIHLAEIEASPDFIYFLSSLSLHCFTNEYIYFETEEETELVSSLEAAIAESFAQASQPSITDTLCLATYRPIYQYDWTEDLKVLDQVPEVKERLIEEPRAEKIIAQEIPILVNLVDAVSHKVREQYEENPYPRWVRLAVSPKAKSMAEVCNELNLRFHSNITIDNPSPSVLIAGCGTGQHPIGAAALLSGSRITAVDLSLASLAYAQRKTRELGIANIEYLQGDILQLSQLEQKFDLIESMGVVHHMNEPMAGWGVLADLLNPGGMMRIGLYSELARRHVVKIREEIALQNVGTSGAEMRRFRHSLVKSNDAHHQLLIRSSDFFSLSMFRDLIFHVQEHRFTIPKIQRSLDQLGLKFCGFENPHIIARFKEAFGKESDACDLSLWHQFEESHPSTFAGMYQFWCQKL